MSESFQQFCLRLSEDEITALKELLPPRSISPLLRKIIQAIILDAPIPPGLSANTTETILRVKANIMAERHSEDKLDTMKKELFKFFSEKRVPAIYARNGESTAKKACFELIPAFRYEGYLLPECYVKQFVIDYIRKIEKNGEILEQYKEGYEAMEGIA